MKPLAVLLLLLAGCGQQADAPEGNQSFSPAQKRTPSPPAKPFSAEQKADLYEFDFSWPAEAAAIPELAQRLRAEMEKSRAELIGGAEEEKAMRDKEGMSFNPHSSSTGYETAGQSARLLSLRVDSGGYSGGAHGHAGTGSLIWDRKAGQEIDFASLFAEPANRDRLLTQGWCDALSKAREEKRGEPVGGGGMFDDCPLLDEIAIIPVDGDKDGRFDRILLVASPYVAGPWVEGSYEIELDVTPGLVAALKREFQPGFES